MPANKPFMRLAIFGAPGSGKGTQSRLIAKYYMLRHISTGDLLREEVSTKSELGQKIDELIQAGNFVPDDLIWEMLEPKLVGDFILDGYPRNTVQLGHSKNIIDYAIFLYVPEDVCTERILNRTDGRTDDCADIIRTRMRIYADTIIPVLKFFNEQEKLIKIDGLGEAEHIAARIVEKINEKNYARHKKDS